MTLSISDTMSGTEQRVRETAMSGKIIRNKARCRACDDVIESFHVHDFKRCYCGNIFVDGGTDYIRRGWPSGKAEDHIEELSENE